MDEEAARELIAALNQNTAAVEQHTAALNGMKSLLTDTRQGTPLAALRQMVESLKTAMGQLAQAVRR